MVAPVRLRPERSFYAVPKVPPATMGLIRRRSRTATVVDELAMLRAVLVNMLNPGSNQRKAEPRDIAEIAGRIFQGVALQARLEGADGDVASGKLQAFAKSVKGLIGEDDGGADGAE